MKRYLGSSEAIFGMANLNPQKSGLGNIIIWSEHNGISRINKHSLPRVKLGIDDMNISISIEAVPKILAKSSNITSKVQLARFDPGIEYVARNCDIFLKHFNDTTFEFDDEDLFQALRERGEYK